MIEQIYNYFSIEMLYYWVNLGVLPFWLILIFAPLSHISRIFVGKTVFALSTLQIILSYLRCVRDRRQITANLTDWLVASYVT